MDTSSNFFQLLGIGGSERRIGVWTCWYMGNYIHNKNQISIPEMTFSYTVALHAYYRGVLCSEELYTSQYKVSRKVGPAFAFAT